MKLPPAYFSTKTYTHETGLTTTFRQHRATSHCRFLHGYALQVKFVFFANSLDDNGWVVDFGGLKGLKAFLAYWFDHTTVVAADDPNLSDFNQLANIGLIQLRVMPSVGCEAFAAFIFEEAEKWMTSEGLSPRCRLVSVEVSEHGANSAISAKAPSYS